MGNIGLVTIMLLLLHRGRRVTGLGSKSGSIDDPLACPGKTAWWCGGKCNWPGQLGMWDCCSSDMDVCKLFL